jgi:hypothetical protein
MKYRHNRMSQILAAALVCLLGGFTVAAAQSSLAEAARLEESRRKAVKKPAKVYTNGTLPALPEEVLPTPPAARPEQAEAAAADPAAKAPAAAPAPQTDERRTPDYWKKRMSEATAARDANQLMLDALQSRINGLWADFTARDDPAQRTVIANERQKALDEFERRKKQQTDLVKAVTDLEDEARRAGVPPGWLR